MSEGSKSGVLAAILIAAALSLIVNLVRLYGEIQGWAPGVFNTEGGGGGSPLGISWLVLPFGFWFGRRLAKNGSRPSSVARSLLLPIVGFALFAGIAYLAMAVLWPGVPASVPDAPAVRTAEEWRLSGLMINIGAVVCGLATFIAWPRAWLALVFYGVLARIPVIVIQYFALQQNWGTHFEKGPPGMPEEMLLFGLTLAQCGFWPFGWTALGGGLCAGLGALTVKRGGGRS